MSSNFIAFYYIILCDTPKKSRLFLTVLIRIKVNHVQSVFVQMQWFMNSPAAAGGSGCSSARVCPRAGARRATLAPGIFAMGPLSPLVSPSPHPYNTVSLQVSSPSLTTPSEPLRKPRALYPWARRSQNPKIYHNAATNNNSNRPETKDSTISPS